MVVIGKFAALLKKLGPTPNPDAVSNQQAIVGLGEAVKEVLLPLDKAKILSGVYLADITLNTSGVQVAHKLGRAWTGFIVTDRRSSAVIYAADSEDDAHFIKLISSAGSPTIDVLVY
jgi:hypothetical protein